MIFFPYSNVVHMGDDFVHLRIPNHSAGGAAAAAAMA